MLLLVREVFRELAGDGNAADREVFSCRLLDKQAGSKPHVRAKSAASDAPVAVLARRHGVTEPTIFKWKRRTDVRD